MNKLIPVILLIILVAFGVFVLKNKTNNVIRYTAPKYELITIEKDTLVIFSYGTDIEVIKL